MRSTSRRALCPLLAMGLLVLTALGGRASAQLGSRAADEWIKTLDAPDRVAAMKIPEVIAALHIDPGQTVADVGAGSGVISGPLALATGSTGVMYAVDIDKALLAHIAERARDQKIGNIKTVLGTFTDPKLPTPVDLAFMNDVLHHVQDRATYLQHLARYLEPGGRLAIIDYKAASSPHRDNPDLVVSEAQVDGWARAAGLVRAESVKLFEDRYFLIYAKR